ncbi:hypothetical protein AGR6A_pAt60209 [Agrobacterium sp. NCPPB 925]|nr:hypothetical protein AGR6A_pAt60209 [Agrobacterium sp. NCPPB 925]
MNIKRHLLGDISPNFASCHTTIQASERAFVLTLTWRSLFRFSRSHSSVPLKSNYIRELLHSANRIEHLSQQEIRQRLNVAAILIGRALNDTQIRNVPLVLEAENYLRAVNASKRELHSQDAKAAFLHAAHIIHVLKKSAF